MDPVTMAAIVSAGSSLLGSLSAQEQAKKQREMEAMKAQMDIADKNGGREQNALQQLMVAYKTGLLGG